MPRAICFSSEAREAQGATYSAADAANKNTAPEQRARRARGRGSETPRRQNPAAALSQTHMPPSVRVQVVCSGHLFFEAFLHGFEPAAVDLPHLGEVPRQVSAANEFGKRRLRELVGVQIGRLLYQPQALDHAFRARCTSRRAIPGTRSSRSCRSGSRCRNGPAPSRRASRCRAAAGGRKSCPRQWEPDSAPLLPEAAGARRPAARCRWDCGSRA